MISGIGNSLFGLALHLLAEVMDLCESLKFLAIGSFGVLWRHRKLAGEPIVVSWIGDLVVETHPGLIGSALSLFRTIGMSSAVVVLVLAGWIRGLTGSLQGSLYLSAGMLVLGAFCLLIPRETSNIVEMVAPLVK